MIEAIDHLTIQAADAARAALSYATLLDQKPAASPFLHVSNAGLEFVSKPAGADDGLAGLAFAAADLAKAQNLLERRGLRVLLGDGSLHLATDSTHGVPIRLVEWKGKSREGGGAGPATVSGLDHVVIRTPNPERAIALYAGRLGLSLRLDRSEPTWGARLLFFRCGDLVVEIAHDLKAGIGDGKDTLWGLSWRVPDISAAHGRLKGAGLDVSEVRTGRRPGSKVFTVRSHTAGVPTIMIGMTG
jgi:catechol 2,3-dioxygenase-like lactoylglutathione lyase family enzyme